jgi:hypothetical protein
MSSPVSARLMLMGNSKSNISVSVVTVVSVVIDVVIPVIILVSDVNGTVAVG